LSYLIINVIGCYKFHLCDSAGELDAFELFHDHFDFIFAIIPYLLDLSFLSLAPISALSSLVFFEIFVEFPQQVLIGTLAEDYFQLRNAVLMSSLLTLAQKVKNFFFAHAEASP